MADDEMIPVAFDRRISEEVIEVRVVGQPGGLRDGRVVVHELAEEAERVRLAKSLRSKIVQLHLKGVCFVMERGNRTLKLRIKHRQCLSSGQTGPKGLRRRAPHMPKLGAGPRGRG
jgi:hypothetical protein